MADDFCLYLVDWTALERSFDSSELCSLATRPVSVDGKSELRKAAEDFRESLLSSDMIIASEDIAPHHRWVGSFKLWCAFATVYAELRPRLNDADLVAFDELYLPFVEPWITGSLEGDPLFDLPERMSAIRKAGFSMFISPDRCAEMARGFALHSFSRLVHVALTNRAIPPPIPGAQTHFPEMTDPANIHFRHLHADFTRMTEGWYILASDAVKRKWGLMAC